MDEKNQLIIGSNLLVITPDNLSRSGQPDQSQISIQGKTNKNLEIQDSDCNSQVKYYYSFIFSSNQTTKSIKLRNQAIEGLDDDAENYQVISRKNLYQRRKKRVKFLQQKEQQQVKILDQLSNQDNIKFQAILSFLKFFYSLKQKVKVDYYSHKTFCAIKASSTQQLTLLLNIFKKIYYQARQNSNIQIDKNRQKQTMLIKQFLIIPRFLISRQKIQQFIKSQQIQDSFRYLVQKLCLGHQNNQANKKMPDKQLINLLKQILERQNGKQCFKTICSINHGNKYRLENGGLAYIQLYYKQLNQLKLIDKKIKQQIKKITYQPTSTIKTKSIIQIQSDQDFIPIKKSKSKCKIRTTFSLGQQIKQQNIHKSKLKHSQSANTSQFNSDPFICSFQLLQEGNISKKNSKISQEISISPQKQLILQERISKKEQLIIKEYPFSFTKKQSKSNKNQEQDQNNNIFPHKIINNIILIFPPNE